MNTIKFKQADEIICEKVGNQTIILLPEKGKILELNRTASFIWEKLDQPKSIKEIIKLLSEKFSSADSKIDQDVHQAIDKLSKLKLIEKVKPKDK